MPDTSALLSQIYVELDGANATTVQAASARGDPPSDLMSDLIEATIESSLHLPDVATLMVHDPHLHWIDDPRLAPGKKLKISFKSGGVEATVFDGEIVELEPAFSASTQELTVRAFDRLHRVARGRKARTFQNVTDGDIAKAIASELGLSPKVGPTSVVHPHVFQRNETNLDLLQRRATALGYLVWVEGTTLHFEPPPTPAASIALEWGRDLSEFRPRLSTLGQLGAFTVRSWDPDNKQAVVGQATQGESAPKVGEPETGSQMVSSGFNMSPNGLVTHRVARTQSAADEIAKGQANRVSGQFIEAEGTCAGNPKLVAGATVEISAVGQRFGGTYVLTAATHHYSHDRGYATHISVSGHEPATLLSMLEPPRDSGNHTPLTIGVVTDNNDPQKQGRVKVKYPSLTEDHGSDWARLISVGAGQDRGIAFVPEVNDEVLVGFEQGDINAPYVLGGLWNGRDAPPSRAGDVVSGGTVQKRVLQSRTGHAIWFDDSSGGGGITIRDSKGNKVVITTSDGSMAVDMQGTINVTAKGDVSVRSQGSVSVQATGSMTLKGMGITIDAGAGQVSVKGSTINLN